MDKFVYLKKYFGYENFRYPQAEIIDSVVSGRDTIAIMPTGFGKSVTFQIPALMLEGLTMVISPLIALMEDQKRILLSRNIKADVLNSNLSYEEQIGLFKRIRNNEIKILYVSAERLENKYFKKEIANVKINLVVLDEAHTVMWADGFREAFGHINNFINILPNRPTLLALTATATDDTINKIKKCLGMLNPNVITSEIDRPNLNYYVYRPLDKFKFLLKILEHQKQTKGIIYCLTRRNVAFLSSKLQEQGIKNVIYHGGLDEDIKNINQGLFTKGVSNLMICTNAFGMGIDIPDIRFIVNYEIPQSIEDLVQEMGRAARDGRAADCYVLFSFKDINTIKYFIDNINCDNEYSIKKQLLRKLAKLIDFCLSKECRHLYISNYFGMKIRRCKFHCDNCKKK